MVENKAITLLQGSPTRAGLTGREKSQLLKLGSIWLPGQDKAVYGKKARRLGKSRLHVDNSLGMAQLHSRVSRLSRELELGLKNHLWNDYDVSNQVRQVYWKRSEDRAGDVQPSRPAFILVGQAAASVTTRWQQRLCL